MFDQRKKLFWKASYLKKGYTSFYTFTISWTTNAIEMGPKTVSFILDLESHLLCRIFWNLVVLNNSEHAVLVNQKINIWTLAFKETLKKNWKNVPFINRFVEAYKIYSITYVSKIETRNAGIALF